MNYSVVQSAISRQLDGALSAHGIGFSEFMVLYHLNCAEGQKLRRVDLAERVGLTASGVTRLVSPMEKIGLVRKEANKRDARVSLVKLSAGGQRIFTESAYSLNAASESALGDLSPKAVSDMQKSLITLGGNVQ